MLGGGDLFFSRFGIDLVENFVSVTTQILVDFEKQVGFIDDNVLGLNEFVPVPAHSQNIRK